MGLFRMSTDAPWYGFAYWLGRLSRQFRENWHHNTGTWLWGLASFTVECHHDELPPRRELSREEYTAFLDEIFRSRRDLQN